MIILGINAYHGDASAALIQDGRLIAAVEEERFRRVKHWAGFPSESIRACLAVAGATAEDIDHIAISRDPQANLLPKALFMLRHRPNPRLLWQRMQHASRLRDVVGALVAVLDLPRHRVVQRLHWIEHHPAHLASAYYVSPFDEAAVCTLDGFGDFASTSWAIGQGASLQVMKRVFFPHSLGLLYLAITQYLGFPNYGDEYKVMGLAPYGEPDYVRSLRQLIHLRQGGEFALDLSYFCHWSTGDNMTWDDGEPTIGPVYTQQLEALLGPARQPEELLEDRHKAIAASLQLVFEEAVFHVLNALHQRTRLSRLCLAGGCAMNSVANGKLRTHTPFQEVYIQPAAGDNGTALGAAFYVWHQILQQPRDFVMQHSYWGPQFDDAQLHDVLRTHAERLERQECLRWKVEEEEKLCQWTAEQIARGKVVGWFQGRMEWGARALGNRSILADPRRADMREILNSKIKLRESFRPFAPSILEEALDTYCIGALPDPFMLQVYAVRPVKRQAIPAVTHIDGTARLQTVSRHSNPLYWQLLRAFEKETGIPLLLNTSFNEQEPIVHNPDEALDCFLRTDMDILVLGSYVVEKTPLDLRR